jgi:hypothetical protein
MINRKGKETVLVNKAVGEENGAYYQVINCFSTQYNSYAAKQIFFIKLLSFLQVVYLKKH